jgi:hypothetical protein
MRPTRLTCLACLLVVAATGCSWFRHKPEAPAAAEVAAPASPATTSTPAENAATVATEPAQGPVAVALDFLVMHQRLGNSGLPQRADQAAYDAFLCPSLSQALRAAKVRQEQAKAEHPDDKPPYVEGDLFSSLFEGPDTFEASDTTIEGALAHVAVAMTHGEGDQARRWKDTLDLRLDDGIWCLADVQYGGEWPFANQGSLSRLLSP